VGGEFFFFFFFPLPPPLFKPIGEGKRKKRRGEKGDQFRGGCLPRHCVLFTWKRLRKGEKRKGKKKGEAFKATRVPNSSTTIIPLPSLPTRSANKEEKKKKRKEEGKEESAVGARLVHGDHK